LFSLRPTKQSILVVAFWCPFCPRTLTTERSSAACRSISEKEVGTTTLYKAQEWGKLAEHPGKNVKLLKNPQYKIRFLSEEEEARLLAVCAPALRRIITAGLLTGFRRQELTSLRPEDVNVERDTVSVAVCYSKNGEGRTLPVAPRLTTILHDALATRDTAPTVFVTRHGEAWKPIGFARAFRKACLRTGIGNLGPHILRHTFASRLVMSGVDLRTVQELEEHSSQGHD